MSYVSSNLHLSAGIFLLFVNFNAGYFVWVPSNLLTYAAVSCKTSSSWILYFHSFFWIHPHIISFLSSEYLHIDVNPYCNTFQYHSEVHKHAIMLISFAGVLAQINSADSSGEKQFKPAQWVLAVTLPFLSST